MNTANHSFISLLLFNKVNTKTFNLRFSPICRICRLFQHAFQRHLIQNEEPRWSPDYGTAPTVQIVRENSQLEFQESTARPGDLE